MTYDHTEAVDAIRRAIEDLSLDSDETLDTIMKILAFTKP